MSRMLCGRRKGSILLLGTCWNAELDGGDPLTDRTCLLNTARRALLAQSLLDIARGDPTSNLVKLCEVSYHRPREEIKGRIYPEQVCSTSLKRITYNLSFDSYHNFYLTGRNYSFVRIFDSEKFD